MQRGLAYAVLVFGVGGIAGWIGGVPLLRTFLPGAAPMVFNTAVGLALLGAGLIAGQAGRARWAAGLGAAVALLGAATFLQPLFGFSLGIDELLWKYPEAVPTAEPGRMAQNSAASFALIGAALVASQCGRRCRAAVIVTAAIVFATAMLALFGHGLDLQLKFNWGQFAGMALPTVLGFLAASAALLSAAMAGLPTVERLWLGSLAFYVAAGATVAVVGAAAWVSNRAERTISRSVVQTYDLLGALEVCERELLRMESAMRGFLLTGETRFVEGTATARTAAAAAWSTVERFDRGEGGRLPALAEIGGLVREKMDFALATLETGRSAGTETGAAAIRAGIGPQLMTEISTRIAGVRAGDSAQLVGDFAEIERIAQQTSRLVVFGNLLALGLFGGALALNRGAHAARAQAESALTERNRALGHLAAVQRALLDGTVHCIVATDTEGTITEFNAGAETMLGYRRDELVGRATPTVFHDATEVAARAAALGSFFGRPIAPGFEVFVAHARAGYVEQREWTFVRKDGTRLPVLLSVTALREPGGVIHGFMGIALDMSERQRAAAALRESEERFRHAFEDAGIGMAILDLEGRWVRVNRSLCLIVGYEEHELRGHTFREITHPDDLATDEAHVRDLLAGRARSYQMEKRYIHRSGRTVWIRLTGSLVRREDGQPVDFVAQVEDITARKEVEVALRLSEERTRLFAEHAPAAVAMLDREMRYLVVSRKWLADYGLGEADLGGKSHYDVFPEMPERWKEIHRRCLAGAVERCEADPFDRPGQARMWLSWEVRPWHDPAGAIGGIVMLTADITARKQLEEELAATRDRALEASRLKSEFLATMSHEIRTPMNAIVGMAGLLIDTPLNPEQKEMSRVVLGGAEHLLTIINDILDFSKIEAGKLRIEAAALDLRAAVEETVALLDTPAREKGLALVCTCAPDLPASVVGDGGRLRQVLFNLAGNAIKFTDRGEVAVEVKTSPAGPQRVRVRCDVRDTGIGIPAEMGSRLFQPFTQADASATRRHGGTGLGLAISRQLVESMGGTIGYESEPGAGSLFWFEIELPLADATLAPPPSVPATGARERRAADLFANRETPAPAVRVLVAEDNPANQLVARILLEKLGFQVETADNGERALARLAEKRFDAMLLDCQMPVLDGYETARRIRAGAVPGLDRKIPVIALTAYALPEDRLRCLEVGMDDYLTKPVRATALQEALLRQGVRGNLAIPQPAAQADSAPEPEGSGEDALDPQIVASLRALPARGGDSLYPHVRALVLAEVPDLLAKLDAAAIDRDPEVAAAVAHRLAGSCANIGAARMRAAALEVEKAARAQDWPTVEARLRACAVAWAKVRAALTT